VKVFFDSNIFIKYLAGAEEAKKLIDKVEYGEWRWLSLFSLTTSSISSLKAVTYSLVFPLIAGHVEVDSCFAFGAL